MSEDQSEGGFLGDSSSSEPLHWTQQPFDGRPMSFGNDAGPAPGRPPAGPPTPERNLGPMVAAGVAVVALLAAVVVLRPWSSGPDRTHDTLATSSAGDGQSSDLASPAADLTTSTTTPPELSSFLPDAAALEGLSRQGIPQSAFNARWVMRSDEDLPNDPADPGCVADTAPISSHGRVYSLAPTGTTGELGDYGYVVLVVDRFASASDAQRWVAAHDDPAVVACLGKLRHEDDMQRFGPTLVDWGIAPQEPVSHGRALTYWVTSTATGRPCTTYTDKFWNQVGPYAFVGTFEACGMHLEPAKVRALVEGVLASLASSPSS